MSASRTCTIAQKKRTGGDLAETSAAAFPVVNSSRPQNFQLFAFIERLTGNGKSKITTA
jgi:hypothetical protein